jgi:hypothetical protein
MLSTWPEFYEIRPCMMIGRSLHYKVVLCFLLTLCLCPIALVQMSLYSHLCPFRYQVQCAFQTRYVLPYSFSIKYLHMAVQFSKSFCQSTRLLFFVELIDIMKILYPVYPCSGHPTPVGRPPLDGDNDWIPDTMHRPGQQQEYHCQQWCHHFQLIETLD